MKGEKTRGNLGGLYWEQSVMLACNVNNVKVKK